MENSSFSNDKIKREKYGNMLIWACFLVYLLMMGSKNAYTAEIVEIQKVFSVDKAQASLAMTYYFILYAIIQVVISPIMSKINLRIYITVTALLSSIVTIMLAYMGSIEMLYLLCGINGALQAGIYSGCMSLLGKYLPKSKLPFANTIMSAGTAAYGVLSYGVPAIFVAMGRWDLPFTVMGAMFFGTALFFFYAVTQIRKFPPQIIEDHGHIIVADEEKPLFELKNTKAKTLFFVIVFVLSLVGSTVHYAVFNWIPNLLHEVFFMPEEYSILITLIAPILMFIGSLVGINLCEKYKNIFAVSMISTVLGLVMFLPILFAYDFNIVITIIFLVLNISILTCARCVYLGVMAFKMRSQINTGAYLAFYNAVSAVSAGVAPPIAGKIIDLYGYGTLFFIVLMIALIFLAVNTILTIWYANLQKKNK